MRGSWRFCRVPSAPHGGSSPRAWVLVVQPGHGRARERFIPTCVGLGRSATAPDSAPTVHPHVRGSWPGEDLLTQHPRGSSPRAWVLDLARWGRPGPLRFIPTCVGLGGARSPRGSGNAVHPHVRGSWVTSRSVYTRKLGSSPRAWVLAEPADRGAGRARFIPTCVGLGAGIAH